MPSPFVAVGGTPVDQPPIQNEAFWPDIDPDAARAAMKLDGTVTPERLREALITAMGDANWQLTAWATQQQAAGYATLSDVPAQTIDGTSLKLAQYRRAVYALAAANLIERYRSIDTSRQGIQTAGILEEPIDDLRRDAHWALNDLRGNGRTTIELI